MPSRATPRAEGALRAALALGLEGPEPGGATELALGLAGAFGPATAAVVHYGSHAQRTGAPADSAQDFFVILDQYPAAYRALAAHLDTRFRPGAASLLNRILPPNVISVTPRGLTAQAKCAVLSLPDLTRGCSGRARDQFVRGRRFQPVRLAFSRDAASREAVTEALIEARACTFEWVRPFLPRRFDAPGYCMALLRTSFAHEIRPEGHERLSVLLEDQRGTLLPVYAALLEDLAARGVLAREGDTYRDLDPPGALARTRRRLWFARSKARATLRWAKYIALYDDWLDYVVRKVERRGGVRIELTERERRWPLLFLWPRALRFLIHRPQRRR